MRHFPLIVRALPASALACGLLFAPLARAETTKTETETTVTTKKQKAAKAEKDTSGKKKSCVRRNRPAVRF